MKLNNYFVQVAGGYSLGVNNVSEAVFAAWGDYSLIEGIGYPSIIGDFFESHSDEYAYNSDTLDYEDPETLELLESVLEKDVVIYAVNDDGTVEDATKSLLQFPVTNMEVAKKMWETRDA